VCVCVTEQRGAGETAEMNTRVLSTRHCARRRGPAAQSPEVGMAVGVGEVEVRR
jgi:hypothetical protein